MIINFPPYADLGTPISQAMRNEWDNRVLQLQEASWYFDGGIFDERVALDGVDPSEAPLLYPVKINLVKMIALALADSVLGEFHERPIEWFTSRQTDPTAAEQAAIDLLNGICADSGEHTFWEVALDAHVYGGGILQIFPDIKHVHGVKWVRVPADRFFAIPDSDNPDQMREVFIITWLTQDQARAQYGIASTKQLVVRVEHWTRSTYTTTVDGTNVSEFSGKNPWGVVPFVYIPRYRARNWYGDSVTADIVGPQNEMNMRVADIGEAINYNAHPVRWGRNLPSGFSAKNFPLEPNALWDLGRAMGSDPPEVGVLEAQTAVSPAAFEFVKFLYDWSRTSTFAPPVAFGEDNGGGQRSGQTLVIRMWPLMKAMRRTRMYYLSGLKRAVAITAKMLGQKAYSHIAVDAVKALGEGGIVPVMATTMPRDHTAAVDEVVKLSSTTPPSISRTTAQKVLGRDQSEVERIDHDLKTAPEALNEVSDDEGDDQDRVPDG